MQCADAELVLSRVLDGDWDGYRAQESRSHLTACRDCRELFANLLLVQAMGRVARGEWGKGETCQVFAKGDLTGLGLSASINKPCAGS